MRSLICSARVASRSASTGFFSSRDYRPTTLLLFWSFAAVTALATANDRVSSITASNCAVRRCTFPLVGPLTTNRMAPLIRSAATRTPRRTHASRACVVICAPPHHDKRVDRFKRNPLTALRRGHHQGPPAMSHASAVIPHVDGAQVAHRKTTFSMYRFTLRGALDSSGRQWCKSWHSLHRASLGASGNSTVSS